MERKKAKVYDENANVIGELELPLLFIVPVRADLIRRAFLAAFTARLQPKGRDPMAGRRTTAYSWGVGYGLARVPRNPNGRARFVVSARGGHIAFPPRPDRRIWEDINKKERAYAIASAIAATGIVEYVRKRGHVFNTDTLPIIVDDRVEEAIDTAKKAREYLEKLGVWSDIERSSEGTGIRSGKGKMRGRRYVEPKSILFVVSSVDKPFARAVRNMPGVDVATPGTLSILDLAPGGVPGRLTVYTKSALEELAKKYEVLVF
ncbi:50S ribosomal protein L4 [Thermogladius sp. 4427co]|uniref:50S ribosomal protein L4 n=1 Tax=Thermogladius sp. 4427co TaxID=3450718 RepID=UPI003F79781D